MRQAMKMTFRNINFQHLIKAEEEGEEGEEGEEEEEEKYMQDERNKESDDEDDHVDNASDPHCETIIDLTNMSDTTNNDSDEDDNTEEQDTNSFEIKQEDDFLGYEKEDGDVNNDLITLIDGTDDNGGEVADDEQSDSDIFDVYDVDTDMDEEDMDVNSDTEVSDTNVITLNSDEDDDNNCVKYKKIRGMQTIVVPERLDFDGSSCNSSICVSWKVE